MATYYVDFTAGSDASNGTSTGTAWKHCPGDANATGTAASTLLNAGDTVIFKGGVRYFGTIVCTRDGAVGNPITYKWDGVWGAGQPVIDGTDPVTGTWTQCANQSDALGNVGWANIWKCPRQFVGQTAMHTFIKDDDFLPMAQNVPIAEPVYIDDISTWLTTARANLTTTTLTLASVFTQADSSYWVGAWIGLHKNTGNSLILREITTFDPATDTVTFAAIAGVVSDYLDPLPYTIIGHPLFMTVGTVAFNGTTMYYWPTAGDPNAQTLSVAYRAIGFQFGGCDHITVENMHVRGQYGTSYGFGQAIQHSASPPHYGLTITGCKIKNVRSLSGEAAVGLDGLSDCIVEDSTITDCIRSRGCVMSGDNNIFRRNTVARMGGTGLFMSGVTDSVCEDNTLTHIRGAHGNGISFYGPDLSDVVVQRNHITICLSPITYERASNIAFYNNFVDGGGVGQIDEWTGNGNSGYVRWFNNTLVNSYLGNHLMLNVRQGNGTAQYTIKNNIVDGISWASDTGNDYPVNGGWCSHTYNLWLGVYGSGPTLETGEMVETDESLVFNEPASENYTLKPGSPAIGAGADLSAYFTDDITGAVRSVPWDIGAYAFSDSEVNTTTLNATTLTVG